jgi:hypothetical protein
MSFEQPGVRVRRQAVDPIAKINPESDKAADLNQDDRDKRPTEETTTSSGRRGAGPVRQARDHYGASQGKRVEKDYKKDIGRHSRKISHRKRLDKLPIEADTLTIPGIELVNSLSKRLHRRWFNQVGVKAGVERLLFIVLLSVAGERYQERIGSLCSVVGGRLWRGPVVFGVEIRFYGHLVLWGH